jgi:putative ABC transport system substrate-binding protein
MRRREFIGLVGATAVSWPVVVGAQQAAMPTVGFLSSRSPKESEVHTAAFRRGLSELGLAEGQNVATSTVGRRVDMSDWRRSQANW